MASAGGILSLRMERQCLTAKADEKAYETLYRDLQPGQNVYWAGFGQPPVLSFRAGFDDLEFNRLRQQRHELLKGRFAGGNLGWIDARDLELFAALYRKPLLTFTPIQEALFTLLRREGPLNIQQMKEETGLLVKEITPALHRLQEAFLVYEDQYDGGWDRGWVIFEEMFPEARLERYTRAQALKLILKRFGYRMVFFDCRMARDFYRLPLKEICGAVQELLAEGFLTEEGDGYLLSEDLPLVRKESPPPRHPVYAVHRNDILYKAQESRLKERFLPLCGTLPYDHEPLQYLLIGGEFHGAVVGRFRNGPYDLNDVVCDLPDGAALEREILKAVRKANSGRSPARFLGRLL